MGLGLIDGYNLYKLSRKLYLNKYSRLGRLVERINGLIHNSYIPCTADLGENCEFAFGGIGIVTGHSTKMGNNCTVGQGVTIGGRTGHGGFPTIGDNVFIGAGSRVLGGIVIGNNVVIGVNAVVITDVPDNCVVAGVPAKIIKRDIAKWKEENII